MNDLPGPVPAARQILPARSLITTAEAYARGLTSDQLRSRALSRVFHGVYVVDGDPHDINVRAKAALIVAGEGCLICEVTALQVLGVSLPRRFMDEADTHLLARPGTCGPQAKGIKVHRCDSQAISLTEGDLALLDPIECWLQLAARATLDELVIIADAMMRKVRPLVTKEEMEPIVEARSHTRGICLAREAIELSRPGTTSQAETRVRLALVRAGLPCPMVSFAFAGRRSQDSGERIQMAYPEAMVAIELERGTDPQQVEKSHLRFRALENQGWRVISVLRSDLADPMSLIETVRQALPFEDAVPKHAAG